MQERDIVRFFHAKGVSDTCPACGKDDWGINVFKEDENKFVTLPVLSIKAVNFHEKKMSPSLPGGVPIALCVCSNCAYMRLHNLEAINAWVLDNPESQSENDEPRKAEE